MGNRVGQGLCLREKSPDRADGEKREDSSCLSTQRVLLTRIF